MKEYLVAIEVCAKISKYVKAESPELAKESLKTEMVKYFNPEQNADAIEFTGLKATLQE